VTEALRGDTGYVHEAVYYNEPDQLTSALAPLLRTALARGEGVALACSQHTNRALLEALDDDRVYPLPQQEAYQKAVSAVAYFRDFVEARVADGGHRVCVLGEVAFGHDRRGLNEWRRYEALLNHAMAPYPLWSLCAYETTRVPEAALTTAQLTHPYLRHGSTRIANPSYVDPAEVMREVDLDTSAEPPTAPLLTIPAVVGLEELRRDLSTVLASDGMPQHRVEDMVVAVHEVVTNGLRHGQPPVTVRAWITSEGAICTVTDRGPGIDDPFLGYLPGGGAPLSEGQYGLWMARQLCDQLATTRTSSGFTTRLVIHR
jgi:anti-sigma regulatory factor (Ser/Thr protein kinase)